MALHAYLRVAGCPLICAWPVFLGAVEWDVPDTFGRAYVGTVVSRKSTKRSMEPQTASPSLTDAVG